ncbi:hypothetical protein IFU40_06200 [Microbacterium sp. CFBP 13617]|uniref:hypothetical protein n=1 Tax=Microbacterium sp. CFBP 13617 TaxID=2774035 RepID=UPI0017869014|nr:hypothetical protein [Microbacterium sp. CFBP 13617]MBD8218224.1 hypothetical protein [Microbacterium sp. CFBP 13617]
MSAPLALLIACGVIAVTVVVAVFAIALWAEPRGITSGPAVAAARGLFVGLVLVVIIAFVAVLWGLTSGWA